MVSTKFQLEYKGVVGFHTDQGGRGFQHPTGIVMRSDGRIFVASRGAGPTVGIQMVSKDFEFFGKIGSSGTNVGQMLQPGGLALDMSDNIYVSDEKLNRITYFDPEGEVIGSWGVEGSAAGEFSRPTGLLIDGESIFISDSMNHRIQEYSLDGRFINQWGIEGSESDEIRYPWGLSKGKDDQILVADWGNDRISTFTKSGEHVGNINSGIGSDKPLNRPAHAVLDNEGNMYVADWGNQILQVFSQDGHLLDMKRGEADLNPWALEYFESQQDEKLARSSYVPVYDTDTSDVREVSARIEPFFWDPCAVMLDENKRVYVLETCRHRFQMFDRI